MSKTGKGCLYTFPLCNERLIQPNASCLTVMHRETDNILVVWVLDKLNDNILGRLDLQHFQYQTQKGCGLDVAAIVTTHMV